MTTLNFNQRAAIAATLEDLAKDLDFPVHIEGDMWGGPESGYGDMPEGEAARIIVDTVLDHPYVKEALAERDAYWEALKWTMVDAGINPEAPPQHQDIFIGAFAAAVFEPNA